MLTGDFIAGVTTALTVIPQGIGRSAWHCKYWLPLPWEWYLYICRVCAVSRASPTIWALCKHRPWLHLLSSGHHKAKSPPLLGDIMFIRSDRSSLRFHMPQIIQCSQPAFFTHQHVAFALDHYYSITPTKSKSMQFTQLAQTNTVQ